MTLLYYRYRYLVLDNSTTTMAEEIESNHTIRENQQGGLYVSRQRYSFHVKHRVIRQYKSLKQENNNREPTIKQVSEASQVSVNYAWSVLQEYKSFGYIEDPRLARERATEQNKSMKKLGPADCLVLLALRLEDDQRPLYDYRNELFQETGTLVCNNTIDDFFKRRCAYKGSLRVSSLVPLDKMRPENVQKGIEFFGKLAGLPNRFKYHWVDEKHVVNKDCMNGRVRRDPLTGRVRTLMVSGNFRVAYNLIAIISSNPNKARPCHWHIGRENGNAAAFVAFIENLITINWFDPYDVLILDNAAIHTGSEAGILADALWDIARVVVVPLPARAPELNPIELIFNTLSMRLRSWKYRVREAADVNVPFQVGRVLGDVTTEDVWKAAAECDY